MKKMTINEYLRELLKFQELNKEELEALTGHRDEVESYLREKFGQDPVIKYAGSHAKGTMIRENYDLDVVCYFPSSDERTLKEIHDDVESCLREQYSIEEKPSAVRILDLLVVSAPNGYHIDVVPGRFIEKSSDVFLHVVYGEKERIQTNLKTHIDHIANSGCVDIIKMMKLWNSRNNLTVRTFILDLFVVKSLSDYREKGDLQKAFVKAMESFRDDFENIQLVDPANSNNIVSYDMDPSHKSLVAQSAKEALSQIAESDDISSWKNVFRDNTQVPNNGPSVIVDPPRQWS